MNSIIESLNKRVLIVTGHFGSGKTELSINLSKEFRKSYDKVNLVDLDIINTYFRLREQDEFLKKDNISVYYTATEAKTLDIPALDPAIDGMILKSDGKVIIDVGGNPSGARALGRYSPVLNEVGYDHLFVVNANRPETENAEQAIEFMQMIEATAQVKVTHIINTTHLLKATTVEDVLRGQKLVEEISLKTGLPVLGAVAIESVAKELKQSHPYINVLPMNLYFRDNWMF